MPRLGTVISWIPWLTDTIRHAIPKEERAALAEEKQAKFRPFTVLVIFLAMFLAPTFWLWDYAVDPIGAMNTPFYRLGITAILGLIAAEIHFDLFPSRRTLIFVGGIVLTQAIFLELLDQLHGGYTVGVGSLLFWFLLAPLVSVGLPLRAGIFGVAAISLVPIVWHAIGLAPGLPVSIFIALVWPAAAITAIMIYLGDLLTLKLVYDQKMLRQAKEEAEALSLIDPLSGMNNRRAFFELGGSILNAARRNRSALSVVMIDIDRFKTINDTWGHKTGDEVIKRVAALILDTIRGMDISGRLGGEEFAVIMPNTALHQAHSFAERLRKAVNETAISADAYSIAVSISLGVAEVSDHDGLLDDILQQADEALLRAKDGGRNRTIVSGMAD